MALLLPRQTLKELAALNSPEEFSEFVFKRIDLSKITVSLNRVLTAVYIASERTAGGIIKPMSAVEEEVYQGKPCLVLKCGPAAFQDDSRVSFYDFRAKPGMWCTFRMGNATQIEINNVACRMILDDKIEAVFSDPRMVTS